MFKAHIIINFYSFQEMPNYSIFCLMCSHVSFALLMKACTCFYQTTFCGCTPLIDWPTCTKQMLLAFPPFITWSLSSKSFLCGILRQSNIVPIRRKQSNMNANLQWLMYYKQKQEPKIRIKNLSLIDTLNHRQQKSCNYFHAHECQRLK